MANLLHRPPMPRRKRNTLRVPESHTLYLCPEGCGRRHALRAFREGADGETSFYILDDTDIIAATHQEDIARIVEELLGTLPTRPRVLTLYFHCIDDLLGIDDDALLAELTHSIPDIRFLIAHVNPIDDRKHDMQGGIYSLLERTDARDGSVNIVGRFNDLPPTSEFATALRSWGVPRIRNIALVTTYDEYAALSDSSLNVVTTWMGEKPAQRMERELGIPAVGFGPSYDIDTIVDHYRTLAAALGVPFVLDDGLVQRARRAVDRALDEVGDTPLVVDSLASFTPFALAEALLGYGFRVEAVLALHTKSDESAARDRIGERYPQVALLGSATAVSAHAAEADRSGLLAIGNDGRALFRTERWLDMFHDEGCFGLDGVVQLMDGLVQAHRTGTAGIGR